MNYNGPVTQVYTFRKPDGEFVVVREGMSLVKGGFKSKRAANKWVRDNSKELHIILISDLK